MDQFCSSRRCFSFLICITILCVRSEAHKSAHKSAVVTNGIECSNIAKDILKKGGSAADAAVSALLCEGVTCPQSTGLGGGFVMTIYHKDSNKVETLIARDMAPLAATENMFDDETEVTGGKAIAVPGELKGYWELHQKYGKLDWSELFDPVIKLCRKGHIVSPHLDRVLSKHKEHIKKSPSFKEIYVNPDTNDIYKEGDFMKQHKLADTLEIIQNEGADSMYNNGTVAQMIVQDIQDAGGIVTVEDLMKYNVRWEEPIEAQLKDNKKLYTVPLPSGGPPLVFIMNVLHEYLPEEESAIAFHRMAEAFKFAYAHRSELGDDKFHKESINLMKKFTDIDFAREIRRRILDNETFTDHVYYGAKFAHKDDYGTSNINILAPNGDAISVTATINNEFGSKILSEQTGIVLNNGMDDFSIPGAANSYGLSPSPSNYIEPQKMPLSSMCPSILLDKDNNVELLIGAAGGSKITTSVAYALLRYLNFDESIVDAVRAPRIHHQLTPNRLEHEFGCNEEIIDGLSNIGHEMYKCVPDGFCALTAIGQSCGKLTTVLDPRNHGMLPVY